jgi:hypothetical protein
MRGAELAGPLGERVEGSLRDADDEIEHDPLADLQLLAQLEPLGTPDLVDRGGGDGLSFPIGKKL